MRFARLGLSALVVVVVALAGAIAAPGTQARSRPPAPARGVPGFDARVVGTFAMSATVTVAVHVRGERVGQRLARTWTIVPSGCQGSVCQLLALDRARGGGRHDQLTLQRVGSGRYVGHGVFYVALSCLGRIDPNGSRVPYRITLTVRGAAIVQGIRFARRITATYVNPGRSDATRCPLGPSHDAATYAGRLGSPLPSPPTATFSTVFASAGDSASFTDTSSPGVGGAAIVSRLWQFGDGSSGAANVSTLVAPVHQFSAPGTYAVSLTVRDSNGLSSTGVQVITAPGPPNVSFSAAEQTPGATFSFTDGSTPGLGGAPIVGWHWDFGDPASGSQDFATAQDPSHTFSAPGTYKVTLTVTDANGFQSSATSQVIAQS
jgi:PKD repeat protein